MRHSGIVADGRRRLEEAEQPPRTWLRRLVAALNPFTKPDQRLWFRRP